MPPPHHLVSASYSAPASTTSDETSFPGLRSSSAPGAAPELASATDAALRAECARRGWVVTVAPAIPSIADRILAYLRAQGETTIGVLYRKLDVHLLEVATALRELEGAGLVARDENVVRLTPPAPTSGEG